MVLVTIILSQTVVIAVAAVDVGVVVGVRKSSIISSCISCRRIIPRW